MGPSKAFRPIAPNGNSTDGRQTFFQPARFADVCRRLPTFTHGLQTFTHGLQTFADVHPWFADVCRLLARSALITRGTSNRVPPVGTAAAGPVGADHSIELQPGPHGIPRWPSLVEFSQGIHQVLLLTMVAVTRGILPGDPPSAAADHGGRHSWTTPRGSTKCCCWIPRWPSSYYRCPTSVVLLPERIANA
jgi:hypothetical protein